MDFWKTSHYDTTGAFDLRLFGVRLCDVSAIRLSLHWGYAPKHAPFCNAMGCEPSPVNVCLTKICSKLSFRKFANKWPLFINFKTSDFRFNFITILHNEGACRWEYNILYKMCMLIKYKAVYARTKKNVVKHRTVRSLVRSTNGHRVWCSLEVRTCEQSWQCSCSLCFCTCVHTALEIHCV